MFVVGLTAALCIDTAKGGFWTYLDRIGVSIGLDVALVSRILAVGSIAGAAGAAFAAFLNSRWGRMGPVFACLFVQGITLTIVVYGKSLAGFTAAVIAYYFIWYFFVSNLLGLMSAADRTGRLVSALLAAQTIGLALGPAAGAMVVSDRDFTALAPLGLTAYAVAALLLIPVLRAARSR
jgi:predicted MFS family arabinose efflux permease